MVGLILGIVLTNLRPLPPEVRPFALAGLAVVLAAFLIAAALNIERGHGGGLNLKVCA
jgi:hypothetical protein